MVICGGRGGLGPGILRDSAAARRRAGCAPEPQTLPYRWTQGNAPQAHTDARAVFGPLRLKPGQYLWAAAIPEEGETRVVIDLLTQLILRLSRRPIGRRRDDLQRQEGHGNAARVLDGVPKVKLGLSRKYDNAPMPFMQMYDEKGIAFHGGPNPGYPASHGCVRLPVKFAERLFGLTKVGSKVIIEG